MTTFDEMNGLEPVASRSLNFEERRDAGRSKSCSCGKPIPPARGKNGSKTCSGVCKEREKKASQRSRIVVSPTFSGFTVREPRTDAKSSFLPPEDDVPLREPDFDWAASLAASPNARFVTGAEMRARNAANPPKTVPDDAPPFAGFERGSGYDPRYPPKPGFR